MIFDHLFSFLLWNGKHNNLGNDETIFYKIYKIRRTNMVNQMAETDPNSIFIGKKPTMSYVSAALGVIKESKRCVIKARGRAISRAVDVAEILTKKFVPNAKYKKIGIDTDAMTNAEGKVSNVSSLEIEIVMSD